MELDRHERQILAALDGRSGFMTRRVAEKVDRFGINARQHSGAVRAWLVGLMKRGLVRYLDSDKHVCWVITPAGAAALREAQRIDDEYQAIHAHAVRHRHL